MFEARVHTHTCALCHEILHNVRTLECYNMNHAALCCSLCHWDSPTARHCNLRRITGNPPWTNPLRWPGLSGDPKEPPHPNGGWPSNRRSDHYLEGFHRQLHSPREKTRFTTGQGQSGTPASHISHFLCLIGAFF